MMNFNKQVQLSVLNSNNFELLQDTQLESGLKFKKYHGNNKP